MKIRKGFVSNSSSTSFTCDACGEVIAYHDSCSSEDLGIVKYNCGHATCKCSNIDFYNINNQKSWRKEAEKILIKEFGKEETKTLLDITDFWEFKNQCTDYEIYNPASFCPVCSLKDFNNDFVYEYILTKYNLNIEDTKQEIKKKFKNLKEFKKWIKESRKIK